MCTIKVGLDRMIQAHTFFNVTECKLVNFFILNALNCNTVFCINNYNYVVS